MKITRKSNNVYIWSAILSIISSFALIIHNISYETLDDISSMRLMIREIRSAFEPAWTDGHNGSS